MVGSIASYYNTYSTLSSVNTQKRVDQQVASFDSDGDGKVSKTEFQTIVDQVSLSTGMTIDVDATFEAADSDSDGLLSSSEMAAFAPQGPPPPPPMMSLDEEESSDSLDTNGDGVVNALDFIESTDETQGTANPMFEELDTDDDGMISKDEFQVFADRMSEMTGMTIDVDATFEAADEDGDGLLSETEMEAFRPQGPPPPPMGGMMAGLEEEVDDEVSALMSSLDTSGDGTIDATELKSALLQMKIDAYSTMFEDVGSYTSGNLDLLG